MADAQEITRPPMLRSICIIWTSSVRPCSVHFARMTPILAATMGTKSFSFSSCSCSFSSGWQKRGGGRRGSEEIRALPFAFFGGGGGCSGHGKLPKAGHQRALENSLGIKGQSCPMLHPRTKLSPPPRMPTRPNQTCRHARTAEASRGANSAAGH